MKYAEGTTVSPETSRLEIERILTRYGASKFASAWEEGQAAIMFEMKNRRVRFTLRFPDVKSFRYSAANRYRTDAQMKTAQQAEIKRLWRSLVLAIKSKLELVESGIVSFEEEFLNWTVLPDNSTTGQNVLPRIEHAYNSGLMPELLPGLNNKSLPPGR